LIVEPIGVKSNYFEEDLIELYLFKSNLNDLINYFFIQTESLVCLYKKRKLERKNLFYCFKGIEKSIFNQKIISYRECMVKCAIV